MAKVAKYNEETNVIDIVDLESQYAGIEQNFEKQNEKNRIIVSKLIFQRQDSPY